MNKLERFDAISERVDNVIRLLRVVRHHVQKNQHIDLSDIQDVNSLMESLRHHVEMHNEERALLK